MRLGFSPALLSTIALSGGLAGFNPMDPYRFVPITTKNIGKRILKNPSRYQPHQSRRQMSRYGRQIAAGKLGNAIVERAVGAGTLSMPRRGKSRLPAAMQALRDLISNPSVDSRARQVGAGSRNWLKFGSETTEPHLREEVTAYVPTGVDLACLRQVANGETLGSISHRNRLRDTGMIEYDRSARKWVVTEAGRRHVAG